MKRIKKLIALAGFIALPSTALAIDSATEMMNLCGFDSICAKKVVTIVNTLASPFTNNTFATFRNAANNGNINVLKVDGSDETILNADSGDGLHLQVNATDVAVATASALTVSQDVVLGTSGNTVALQEATAGAKCMGSATANGTTAVTVSTTCATTGSRIFLSPTSDPTGSTAAYCWATNIVNGTSFDVDCDQANDGTLNWIIFHESP